MSRLLHMRWLILALCLFGAAAHAADGPLVVAHRGASGYLPEHTLPAYAMAYGMGADYIEVDLVLTKDGHFVALHDRHLETTTDVKARYPRRSRDDGRWYAADFTLEEIRGLSVHERMGNRFPRGKSAFGVATLRETIELVQGINQTTGRTVGVYLELKHSAWHEAEGLPMEASFLALLEEYGYSGPDDAIFVQCFEPDALKKLRALGCELPMVQLVSARSDQRAMLTEAGLREIATYAQGIGPAKSLVADDPALVRRAHALGLVVHPYTMRDDDVPRQHADAEAELAAFFAEYGVDGVFTDFPDTAVRVLEALGMRE